jgi:small subunit ribosomal protein S20
MAAGAIPPPLFFGQRPPPLKSQMGFRHGLSRDTCALEKPAASITRFKRPARSCDQERTVTLRIFETMANTTSAKKATRKIARRTAINKSRRTQMRGAVRRVEDAIKRGDRDAAVKAMTSAEPELMRAAQRHIVHKNTASRKVSRLAHQIAKLGK